MIRPPFFKVDYGAGARISAEIRKRNKEAYAELVENSEKISTRLRAWQVALHRSTQWLEAFEEVR
jgi:hypothetical protein